VNQHLRFGSDPGGGHYLPQDVDPFRNPRLRVPASFRERSVACLDSRARSGDPFLLFRYPAGAQSAASGSLSSLFLSWKSYLIDISRTLPLVTRGVAEKRRRLPLSPPGALRIFCPFSPARLGRLCLLQGLPASPSRLRSATLTFPPRLLMTSHRSLKKFISLLDKACVFLPVPRARSVLGSPVFRPFFPLPQTSVAYRHFLVLRDARLCRIAPSSLSNTFHRPLTSMNLSAPS